MHPLSPQEAIPTQEMPEQRGFRYRALQVVGGIGLVAVAWHGIENIFAVGREESVGLTESAKYAGEFGLNCVLTALSVAVLNKNHPKQP